MSCLKILLACTALFGAAALAPLANAAAAPGAPPALRRCHAAPLTFSGPAAVRRVCDAHQRRRSRRMHAAPAPAGRPGRPPQPVLLPARINPDLRFPADAGFTGKLRAPPLRPI